MLLCSALHHVPEHVARYKIDEAEKRHRLNEGARTSELQSVAALTGTDNLRMPVVAVPQRAGKFGTSEYGHSNEGG